MGRKKKEVESSSDNPTADEEKEATTNDQTPDQETVESADPDEAETAVDSTEKTIEMEYAELKDKYLRLYSDFDNYRKRTIKESAEIRSRASGDVMKELLSVLDDFDRAIDNNEKTEDPNLIKEGFKLIQTKLMNTLVAKGLEWMDAKGEKFDPEKHEAITQIPVEKKKDKGKVMDVIERGYNLNGKPLRYAKVVVGQ
ncbi:nucleotide exchange factor GrpE [bacterium AH-315-C20]|nr:nucleotide exchange factor GrpE [bacterium AH-315-C20]